MKKLLFAAAFLLASCEKTPPPQPIQHVYCVTPDQYKKLVDAMPKDKKGDLTGNAQKDFKIAAGQALLLRLYANGLLDVIGGCIGPAPTPAS